jgi:Tfp pilus assembly protein PilE
MEGQPKTSFIPKKPIATKTSGPVVSRKAKGRTLFSLISIIVFVGTLAALGGVFFYTFTLKQKIESQVESLQRTRDEFDERFIQDATRLNARITNSLSLLENHLSPSSLFSLLEEFTLQTVSFFSFDFQDTKDGQIQVSGTGEAARFESIVLQSDSFGESGFMRNVLFTDLEPNVERGTIQFSFSAVLDPRVVLYRNSLPENFDEFEEGDNIESEEN